MLGLCNILHVHCRGGQFSERAVSDPSGGEQVCGTAEAAAVPDTSGALGVSAVWVVCNDVAGDAGLLLSVREMLCRKFRRNERLQRALAVGRKMYRVIIFTETTVRRTLLKNSMRLKISACVCVCVSLAFPSSYFVASTHERNTLIILLTCACCHTRRVHRGALEHRKVGHGSLQRNTTPGGI